MRHALLLKQRSNKKDPKTPLKMPIQHLASNQENTNRNQINPKRIRPVPISNPSQTPHLQNSEYADH